MPDYSKGKLYKICSDIDEHFYIGSTCDSLSGRMKSHRYSCNTKNANNKVYKYIRENGGFDNWKIILIRECPCENKEQLLKHEDDEVRKYIKTNLCLNTNNVVLDVEEHKQSISEYHKQYRIDNADKLKQQRKEYKEANKDIIKQNGIEYREKNNEIIKEKKRLAYHANKERINAERKLKYEANKDEILRKKREKYLLDKMK